MTVPPRTAFLASLSVPGQDAANKTRVATELLATKNIPPNSVSMLGARRDGISSFYYFRVPGAIVEIEVYWDDESRAYNRAFTDVYDDPKQVAEMLGVAYRPSGSNRPRR